VCKTARNAPFSGGSANGCVQEKQGFLRVSADLQSAA
jgi:hypothetical protein